ncbi:MAG: dTDP-4-dehydrorhamnose reductase [Pyrinomonadaceae bacterium]|nr:dTDP-4-dehydrorhamnose reductase [Pyrinomonadaceae bacterium]MBP6212928.1 dTDP-4-dehydrorhamnose reductase [Pyrinomonadaceae bacterium]
MKVLITGANGMVARAAIGYCGSIGDDVVGLTRQDLDIGDLDAVRAAFEDIRPQAVINCAAYTDVDGAETNVEACYRANSIGVENLAIASGEVGASFVTISTDYVFDGTNPGFYAEDDEPNPQGVYAKSKLKGEQRAAAANPNSIVIRSGWIYGAGGTNFLSIMHRLLADGKRIKAICDSYGTPTFAGDLAKRLRELAECGIPGIFHVTNSGDGTSYLGFAEAVCEIGGFDPNLIESVSNDELKRPAPRPASSKLGCGKSNVCGLGPLPHWRDALSGFLGSEI